MKCEDGLVAAAATLGEGVGAVIDGADNEVTETEGVASDTLVTLGNGLGRRRMLCEPFCPLLLQMHLSLYSAMRACSAVRFD